MKFTLNDEMTLRNQVDTSIRTATREGRIHTRISIDVMKMKALLLKLDELKEQVHTLRQGRQHDD